MLCNSIDFLCRFYVFLCLNLPNFVKITYACENSELQQLVLRNVLNQIRGTHVIYDPEWMSITLFDCLWPHGVLKQLLHIHRNYPQFCMKKKLKYSQHSTFQSC